MDSIHKSVFLNPNYRAFLELLQTLPPLLMAVFRLPAGFLLILGHQAVRGINRSVLSDRVLRYVYADKRATVLSLSSLLSRLLFALTGPVIGWLAIRFGLFPSLAIQGGVLIVVFLSMLVAFVHIPEKYFRVKTTVIARQ